MSRIRDGETALALAVSRSDSLRTTVPANIVRKLGLGPKDRIIWDVDKINNEWIATIHKAPPEE